MIISVEPPRLLNDPSNRREVKGKAAGSGAKNRRRGESSAPVDANAAKKPNIGKSLLQGLLSEAEDHTKNGAELLEESAQ